MNFFNTSNKRPSNCGKKQEIFVCRRIVLRGNSNSNHESNWPSGGCGSGKGGYSSEGGYSYGNVGSAYQGFDGQNLGNSFGGYFGGNCQGYYPTNQLCQDESYFD